MNIQTGYFRGGSNININVITCESNIVILQWFQPNMRKITQWLSQLPIKGTQFAVHVLQSKTLLRINCAGTTNPGGTRKPDNPLKGIQNQILQDLDNPLKGIRDLLQNRTRSQWPRGLTIPTQGYPHQPRLDINSSNQPLTQHANGIQLVYVQPLKGQTNYTKGRTRRQAQQE